MSDELNFSWFDVINYEEAKTFNIQDWHSELNYRHLIQILIEHEPNRMAPFINEFIAKIKVESFSRVGQSSWGNCLSVRNIGDVVHTNADGEQIDPVDDDLIVHVEINLAASDKQIKEDFNLWLQQQRKQTPYSPKLFKQSDLDKWAKHKVIAYIDLMLISRYENINITQNMIGKMLFPNEYNIDLTERIRQTVKPLAEMLMQLSIQEALLAQSQAR